jgi:hypothetical protein
MQWSLKFNSADEVNTYIKDNIIALYKSFNIWKVSMF